MAATLDRKRPYGTVHGGNSKTRFEQDGKEFDGAGQEIVAPRAVAAKTQDSAMSDPDGGTAPVTKDAQGNLFRDGQILDTDDMTIETLHVLAKDMGLRLHPATKKAKVLAAITEAAGPVDQLAAQLGG